MKILWYLNTKKNIAVTKQITINVSPLRFRLTIRSTELGEETNLVWILPDLLGSAKANTIQILENEKHEQFNVLTAFVDASTVYGSSLNESNKIRDGGSCKLKLTDTTNLLKVKEDSFITGDTRAAEMPGLATVHTVFAREHNRICDLIDSVAPTDFTQEDRFQNARRILIAEMQKIVYGDYLPIILGSEAMESFGLNLNHESDYNPATDPSIANSFATAAFRFGHSMIQGLIKLFTVDLVEEGSYLLGENFFNIDRYNEDMEAILAGLTVQAAQTNDRHVTGEVTNKLFADASVTPIVGQDLVSRNIQRSRDHGIPSYAAFYKEFVSNDANVLSCWDQKPNEISQQNWDILATIYLHPHHIDLFVGGLAETAVEGGIVGPTFNKIIGRQYKELKDGDRFFFTHTGQMNSAEYAQIKGRSLVDLICDNSNITRMNKDVFKAFDDTENPRVICGSHVKLDINQFKLKKVA